MFSNKQAITKFNRIILDKKCNGKDAIFNWSLTPCKKPRYNLILSRDIDDQAILQLNWMRGTTGHI